MAMLTTHQKLTIIFGALGNLVSIGVFLSPLTTFYKIYKKRSTLGFSSLPYAVGFFSAAILLYYGSLKQGEILLITINSFGCFIEVIYLIVYITYTPGHKKWIKLTLIILFDLGGCCLVILLTYFLTEGSKRITIVGWINVAINLCVFAAPLNAMRKVIITRSVECMPIALILALIVNGVMWFFYGFFRNDYFIAGPNVIGVSLALIQLCVYIIYKFCITNNEQDATNDAEV